VRRIAFQGELGAYSEEAVVRACGADAEPVPCRENRDVVRALADAAVDLAVLPLENTLAGTVTASYDAIADEPGVHVVGEVVIPIHHCVLGVTGATLRSLRVIESHPVALAQCSSFFAQHSWLERRAAYDTAGAAREVARARDLARGAIAGRGAAGRYGLVVLAADVEDRSDNQTRFVVLSRTPAHLPDGTPAKTILILSTPNQPGALVRVLAPLAERALNLTKIESRPTGEPWTYRFVLEFEHSAADPAAADALREVRAASASFHVAGTYARNAWT
jgi:prephenate dehydratase/chorismate mutase/prephenate dehydratase